MTEARYRLDPEHPQAPTREQWAAMSPAERERVVAALPSEFPRAEPPEGDRHRIPKERAVEALGEHFRRIRRRIYLSSELPVYYPGQSVFAPDVIAVLDVEPHERDRWVVSAEGKGLDLALEVVVSGNRRKDFERNISRYAALGITEYFVFAPLEARLWGYRLAAASPAQDARYQPILPQEGRWTSEVLALDLSVEDGKIRFFSGSAPLEQSAEIISRLGAMVDRAARHHDELAERLELAEQRAQSEAERAQSEAERAARLAAKLRELGVDPDKLH
jgi:Uma2 family endonuclease